MFLLVSIDQEYLSTYGVGVGLDSLPNIDLYALYTAANKVITEVELIMSTKLKFETIRWVNIHHWEIKAHMLAFVHLLTGYLL